MPKKVKHEDKVVDIKTLIPHPKNPNIHPIDQIEALAKSMEKYGQYYPIIVDEQNYILCGHGKLQALQHKGETKASVKIIYGLSEKDKLKLIIEDNKIQSLSYVNYGAIEGIIKEIGDTDILGFPANFLDSIINEPLVDNMGVDFTQKAEKKENFTPEQKEEQKSEFDNVEAGMQSANVFTCPHCGKEIAM